MEAIAMALGGAACVGVVALSAIVQKRHERAKKRLAFLEDRDRSATLEIIRTRARLYESVAEGMLARAGRGARLEMRFRSQYGEDVLAWEILGRPLAGTFIEIGAYDGRELSVTWALEAMGWNGLLVEAMPERAAQARTNRPFSVVEHAACAGPGSTGVATFSVLEDEQLASDMRSSLELEAWERERVRSGKSREKKVDVPLTTLGALVPKEWGGIDLAVVDVEGAELGVLEGLGMEDARLRPRVLIVEDNTKGVEARVPSLLERHGYGAAGWIGVNRVWVRRDEDDVVRRARDVLRETWTH
ncbi:MAG: FkbM family methyltransferase [Phycisphaerales bacterium]|jgi:FkbM family methyltransferase|nr:FkbM family methyltransferase [Phycisphaerales bacterium]